MNKKTIGIVSLVVVAIVAAAFLGRLSGGSEGGGTTTAAPTTTTATTTSTTTTTTISARFQNCFEVANDYALQKTLENMLEDASSGSWASIKAISASELNVNIEGVTICQAFFKAEWNSDNRYLDGDIDDYSSLMCFNNETWFFMGADEARSIRDQAADCKIYLESEQAGSAPIEDLLPDASRI